MALKRLYKAKIFDESFNEDGLKFCKEFESLIRRFIKRWISAGYSCRDMEVASKNSIGILIILEALKRNCNQGKTKNGKI